MTLLGPRVVTITYLHGPYDGHTTEHQRSDEPMPMDLGDGYVLEGPVGDEQDRTWAYQWRPPHGAPRQPCRAGDERCVGSRCPDGRPGPAPGLPA